MKQDRAVPVLFCSHPDCENAIRGIPNTATIVASENEYSEIGIVMDPYCHDCNVTQKSLRDREIAVFMARKSGHTEDCVL